MHYPFPLRLIWRMFLNDEDPPDSKWISYKDPDHGYVRMEFSAPIPRNKPEVEAPVSNDSSISAYCMFS